MSGRCAVVGPFVKLLSMIDSIVEVISPLPPCVGRMARTAIRQIASPGLTVANQQSQPLLECACYALAVRKLSCSVPTL
jgi:hypothetical protein